MGVPAERLKGSEKLPHDMLYRSLVSLAQDGDDTERSLSVKALGTLKDGDAVGVLIGCLTDPDPDIRCDAAEALACIGDKSAAGALTGNLREDPDPEAKLVYIKSLHSLGCREAMPVLSILATGRGEDHGIAWEGDYSHWDDWLDIQLAAINALGDVGDDTAAGTIRQAILDPDGQDLWAAGCKALAKLGPAGVEALDGLSAGASPLARKRIATALANAQGARGQTLLATLAGDEDWQVRDAAIRSAAAAGHADIVAGALRDIAPEIRLAALGLLEDASVDQLQAALDDVSPKVRIAACDVIAQRRMPASGLQLTARAERALRTASPELLAAMVSAAAVAEPRNARELIEDICNHRATDPVVRRACLRAMATLKPENAVVLLRVAAADKDRTVRLEAVVSLGRLAAKDDRMAGQAAAVISEALCGELVAVPEDWQPEPAPVVEFVPRQGKQSAGEEGESKVSLDRQGSIVSEEPDAAEDPQDETSQDEAEAVARGPVSTLEAIAAVNPSQMGQNRQIGLEPDDFEFLEMTGAFMKRRKANPDAALPLHIDVRRQAALIAGDTGKAGLLDGLIRAAADRDEGVKSAALKSLRQLADSGIDLNSAEDVLLEAAAASAVEVRRLAVEAVGALKSQRAREALEEAAAHRNEFVRAAAVSALCEMDASTDPLVPALRDPSLSVRKTALKAMLRRPDEHTVERVLDEATLHSRHHTPEFAALLRTSRDTANPVLASWIAGDDRLKRRTALDMIPVMISD